MSVDLESRGFGLISSNPQVNDCGKWLNNVGNGQRFEGTYYIPGNLTAPRFERVGDCEPWTVSLRERSVRSFAHVHSRQQDYTAYNQSTKDGLKLVAAGHQDAFKNWFYWTWKTGYSSQLGRIANPVWNYQLGLEQGWMPENPRTVAGACTSLVSSNGFTVPFTPYPAPTLSAWMTGGEGAGTILDVAMSSSFNVWPPTALGTTPAEFLPTYTATGDVITLSGTAPTSYPSGFSSTAGVDNGWFQPADTSSFATPVAGCSYPDPWSGAGAPGKSHVPNSPRAQLTSLMQCQQPSAPVERPACVAHPLLPDQQCARPLQPSLRLLNARSRLASSHSFHRHFALTAFCDFPSFLCHDILKLHFTSWAMDRCISRERGDPS